MNNMVEHAHAFGEGQQAPRFASAGREAVAERSPLAWFSKGVYAPAELIDNQGICEPQSLTPILDHKEANEMSSFTRFDAPSRSSISLRQIPRHTFTALVAVAALAGMAEAAAVDESAWQVAVEVRILRAPKLESIGELDWEGAVKFGAPIDEQAPPVLKAAPKELPPAQSGIAASVQSVSWDYAPFLACVIDQRRMERTVDRFQGDRRFSLLSCPKVTVFSGQQADVRDESYRPFVVGVHYVKGELATAAQPEIAMLSEGTAFALKPTVIDADALDLQCELAVSHIESVTEIKLPGKDVTIQNPRASRRTISTRCRISPGQTLLIAPITSKRDDAVIYAITARWFPDAIDANAAVPPRSR